MESKIILVIIVFHSVPKMIFRQTIFILLTLVSTILYGANPSLEKIQETLGLSENYTLSIQVSEATDIEIVPHETGEAVKLGIPYEDEFSIFIEDVPTPSVLNYDFFFSQTTQSQIDFYHGDFLKREIKHAAWNRNKWTSYKESFKRYVPLLQTTSVRIHIPTVSNKQDGSEKRYIFLDNFSIESGIPLNLEIAECLKITVTPERERYAYGEEVTLSVETISSQYEFESWRTEYRNLPEDFDLKAKTITLELTDWISISTRSKRMFPIPSGQLLFYKKLLKSS